MSPLPKFSPYANPLNPGIALDLDAVVPTQLFCYGISVNETPVVQQHDRHSRRYDLDSGERLRGVGKALRRSW